MNIEFGILGPVSVRRDGSILPPMSAKQRLLLAMLVVRANEVVTLDYLVHGLWGDDPPATAVGVVQTYVSQVRKVLEPDLPKGSAPRLVVTVEPGYRLSMGDPDALDANRFERLLSEGSTALRAGQPDIAAQVLQEGLDLWRGPALAAWLAAVQGTDAVIAPVAPMPAPTLAESDVGNSMEAEAVIQRITRFTRPVNYLGLPSLAIPAGFTGSGLPVGMQLIGRSFDEATILRIGAAFQRATDFHRKVPALP